MRTNLQIIQGQDREEDLVLIWKGKIHKIRVSKMLQRITDRLVKGILVFATGYTGFVVLNGIFLWTARK